MYTTISTPAQRRLAKAIILIWLTSIAVSVLLLPRELVLYTPHDWQTAIPVPAEVIGIWIAALLNALCFALLACARLVKSVKLKHHKG